MGNVLLLCVSRVCSASESLPLRPTHKGLIYSISHCPEKVMQCLDRLSQAVQAEPPTLQNPILRLTYEPSPPSFTIRDIVSAITSSNSPQFWVTIDNPPSLEDRARLLQAGERRSLLHRLGFSVLIAVPTFVIGVVFMSLVSPKNRTRSFLMEPMWTGNASRIQWSLFFLSTPVMFYSAGSFHKRSLKEIRALWRRGSRTPVWKRFIRFGSMNLLVCTFVSHPFTSSAVFLIIGIFRCLGSIFLLYSLACPGSLDVTILGRSCRHNHILRFRRLPNDVPSRWYVP
jgi:Cu+-exporting ATPase